jgi:hypothetical protein
MDNKNKTRFCEKCGNQIKNGDRFCEHCGSEIKPLPMTSVKEKPTDIKSDIKSKKKLVAIISAASAVAVVLAVCAIVLLPKMFGNNNAEQAVKATTQQVTTEISTTAEPTTVESTTIEPTTAKPTEPESSKDDGEGNSNGDGRCYFNGFSIEVPEDYTYEVDGDKVTFYESYNHEHSETGSDGFLFAIDWTYDGTVSIDSSRLGSKDGKYFMYIHPTGFGMLEDEYANQRMVDARAETDDVLSSFRVE